jgi:hypothetical protein
VLDDVRAQFGGGNFCQGTAKFTDCGTASGHDYDVFHVNLRCAGARAGVVSIGPPAQAAVTQIRYRVRDRPGHGRLPENRRRIATRDAGKSGESQLLKTCLPYRISATKAAIVGFRALFMFEQNQSYQVLLLRTIVLITHIA